MSRIARLSPAVLGKKRAWYVLGGAGANYNVDCGSGATLDDIHAGVFCIDGWWCVPSAGANQVLLFKGTYSTTGWFIRVNTAGTISFAVYCATTDRVTTSVGTHNSNVWKYFRFSYDTDRKPTIFVNGVQDGTPGATAGAVDSDAADKLYLGRSATSLLGKHGWIRISNVVRTVIPSRFAPPAVDVNTLALWLVNEGTGTTLYDATTNDNDGTSLANGTWGKE
jgi:hypothetical protein